MKDQTQDGVARQALTGVLLCVAYAAALWVSLKLIGRDAVPPFWPSNAVIAAMVLLLERRVLWACMAAVVVSTAVLMLATSDFAALALMRVMFNVAEGVVGGLLARQVMGPRRLLRTASVFVKLQLFAVLPAAAFGVVLRTGAFKLIGADAYIGSLHRVFLPHVMGMAVILPAALLLSQPTMPELRRSRRETALILTGLTIVAVLLFKQEAFPSSFIISPLLLLTAIRLGPRGAVFGNLLVALTLLPATLHGTGPFALHPEWQLEQRALLYQGVCLTSLLGMSLAAFMVAEQARLRRLLVRRAASAREARRRALTASRAKSDFLATMSHEIRTPMNSILGFTQVLLRDPAMPGGIRGKVEVIAQAGQSLMTVLNDILDFSKVEAGQIELHAEPLDVEACAAHAVEILQAPAIAKGLALRLEADMAPGQYEIDGQRLQQILLNLLNNAVKFTSFGHVLLTVVFFEQEQRLRFEVQDTGIGVDPEVIDRLFTRFSQADSSTTRDYGGSGLGLAICKGLVERMGGRIGVESRLSVGSTFWFEVPARRIEAKAKAAGEAPAPTAPLSGRVLVVDDHAMNRLLGETLLGLLGCEVDLAASGEEAVQACSEIGYDAILMDVHMPKMDGLAAARAIQASGGMNATTPIIAMSADVMARNLEQCRQAGMVDHIAKPVQLSVMHAVLERCMSDHKRRSAA